MAKERGSAYYKNRLKAEYPAIYADLKSGRIKSVRQAAALAGMTRLPTRLDALKRDYRRASKAERAAFLASIGAVIAKPPASAAPVPIRIVDPDGWLIASAVTFLKDWMRKHRSPTGGPMTPGQIMAQMGFKGGDYTLSFAMKRGQKLRDEVVPKLTDWLVKNGFK